MPSFLLQVLVDNALLIAIIALFMRFIASRLYQRFVQRENYKRSNMISLISLWAVMYTLLVPISYWVSGNFYFGSNLPLAFIFAGSVWVLSNKDDFEWGTERSNAIFTPDDPTSEQES